MKLDATLAAIVTGGASGLGEATARMLAGAGVRVAIFDMQAARGAEVAAEIGGVFCEADVASEASLDAAFARARAANGVERVLVNCAGIVSGRRSVSRNRESGEWAAHDLASFQRTISINLIGTFLASVKSAAGMAALAPLDADGQRGLIVTTSSVAAEDGQVGQIAYAASKGAVLAMTLPMARDLAASGIRVMTIQPGLFGTPMFDALPPAAQAALAAGVPFPSRLGRADEFAALVRSIAENDMLNGASIRLDGAIRLAPK